MSDVSILDMIFFKEWNLRKWINKYCTYVYSELIALFYYPNKDVWDEEIQMGVLEFRDIDF